MGKTIKLPTEFDPTPEIVEQMPILLQIMEALQGKRVNKDAIPLVTSGSLILAVKESE